MPDELYAGHAQLILGEGVVRANRLSIHDVPRAIFDRLPGHEKKAQGDGRLTPCRSRRIVLTSRVELIAFCTEPPQTGPQWLATAHAQASSYHNMDDFSV